MAVIGLDHILLAIPEGNEDLARSFYSGILGLKEIVKPQALSGRGGMWFACGNLTVHLGTDPKFQPALKAHPAFLVDELDRLRERCDAHGLPTQDDVPLPGRRRFFVSDPFGNRIELMTHDRGD